MKINLKIVEKAQFKNILFSNFIKSHNQRLLFIPTVACCYYFFLSLSFMNMLIYFFVLFVSHLCSVYYI